MEVWFSSDHHFGHKNIIGFTDRPWNGPIYGAYEPDVTHMNEALITYWNETIAPNDIVYYLGDFALGPKDTVSKIGPRLHGRKHLVSGNHDRCWTGNPKGYNNIQSYHDAGFTTIQTIMTFEGYLLCHFPYDISKYDDRFSGLAPNREYWNRPLIHGHVHKTWRQKGEDQLNVGIDVWDYYPVNFETIRELMPL